MNKKTNLNDTERRVLKWIKAYFVEHGYSPSIRNIAEGITMAHSHVMYCLDMLERFGYIERERRQARSIKVLEGK